MGAWILALCLAAGDVGTVASPQLESMETCYSVGAAMAARGISPELGIALSYTESRFNRRAVSSAGAVGPLQVIPKWFCPRRTRKGCDLIEAGADALVRYIAKYGPRWQRVLCHWSQGNRCSGIGVRFASIVTTRADAFRHRAMVIEASWQ